MPCVLFFRTGSKCLEMAGIVVRQLPLVLDLDAAPAVVGTSAWFRETAWAVLGVRVGTFGETDCRAIL